MYRFYASVSFCCALVLYKQAISINRLCGCAITITTIHENYMYYVSSYNQPTGKQPTCSQHAHAPDHVRNAWKLFIN